MKRFGLMVVAALSAGCGEPEGSWSTGSGPTPVSTPGSVGSTAPALWGTVVVPFGNGSSAIADAESDAVLVMHKNSKRPVRIAFPQGAQPFRVVALRPDLLAVVLRGSGDIARVEVPVSGAGFTLEQADLTHVCDEPRGIAYDDQTDALEVACAGGELVRVAASGVITAVDTGLELRDLFRSGSRRWATTFRTAELVELADDGTVLSTLPAPTLSYGAFTFAPHVAWRTAPAGANRVAMVHQFHLNDEVASLTNPTPTQPYYGSPFCNASVVQSAITVFDLAEGKVETSRVLIGALAVDVAVDPGNMNRVAVAFAGAGEVQELDLGTNSGACLSPRNVVPSPNPTGVAFVGGELQIFDRGGGFTRTLTNDEPIALTPKRPLDDGRDVFHVQSPSGVACASCHPEGHDDGHTWQFGNKRVRSQSLEGGLLQTAPFHWDGRLSKLSDVLDETLVLRMGGVKPTPLQINRVAGWLDALPARPAHRPASPLAHKLGHRTFIEAKCDSCHAGEALTNGTTVDVGTGGRFQVPSLKAVQWRGPWMHDGCAKTLAERFTNPACGGRAHGSVAPGRVPELVEYLKTL